MSGMVDDKEDVIIISLIFFWSSKEIHLLGHIWQMSHYNLPGIKGWTPSLLPCCFWTKSFVEQSTKNCIHFNELSIRGESLCLTHWLFVTYQILTFKITSILFSSLSSSKHKIKAFVMSSQLSSRPKAFLLSFCTFYVHKFHSTISST